MKWPLCGQGEGSGGGGVDEPRYALPSPLPLHERQGPSISYQHLLSLVQ